MKIAHLLITYTNPAQTERLITRLQHPETDFYIHLDKKVHMDTHRNLSKFSNVYFIKQRVDIKWGGYTTIKAVLNTIREIRQTGRKYDFFNLMSGQDYPLKSTDHIHQFLRNHIGQEFITAEHFYTEWQEAISRIEEYHMTDYTFKGRYVVQNMLNRFLPKRKCPMGYEYYGRSMFWTISQSAAEYVADLIAANPKYERFLVHTWAPDEFVFPTILMNSHFRKKIVKDNLLYVNFPAGEASPKTFTIHDLGELQASGKMFGRKFKSEVDIAIMDKLDELAKMPASSTV